VRFTWDTNTSRVGRGWRGTGDAPAVLDDRIMLLGLLFAFAATVLNSWAGLLESDATWRVTRHRPLMTQPRYLGGLLVNGLGWVCTVVALRHLPVFAVQAILGAAITVTAIVACLIGLVLVAASADTSSPPALPSAVHYVLIAATAALVVAIFASWPSSLPWPMAVIAGLGLGGTSLTARAVRIDSGPSALTQLLAQPPTYLVGRLLDHRIGQLLPCARTGQPSQGQAHIHGHRGHRARPRRNRPTRRHRPGSLVAGDGERPAVGGVQRGGACTLSRCSSLRGSSAVNATGPSRTAW
jgi:hypothetical protein